ncbi:MAG: ROK family protein [Clostridia bacterium]|nr:ROK family protein [Clostridia bacterium]
MYIGIDLGGTNIAAGLVSKDGTILKKASVPTKKERPLPEIVRDMALLAEKVAKDGGVKLSDVKAVGIGCPGTIDSEHGVVVYSNNIVMDHFPLAEEFRRHLPLPVHIENDANAAAYGEYITTARDKKSFVFMTLGTGVGGGIILDGRIWRGFNGAGAEMGHMGLIADGVRCTCGRRGCLESYASVTALIRQTKEALDEHPDSLMHAWVKEHGHVSGRTAFECAKSGDEAAIRVRDKYLQYVAEGVCSVISLLQPEVFAIGGGISKEGDALLLPVKAFVEANDFNKYMPRTELRTAVLFGDAGIVGAAMAAEAE